MNQKIKFLICLFLIIIGMLTLFVGALLIYFMVRPNTAEINPDLEYEIWGVESDYTHNAFTDMVYFEGNFYLTFRSAAQHSPVDDSIIVVLKSEDAEDWETVEEFEVDGKDIRDPKMAVIGNKLFIYVVVRVLKSGSEEVTTTRYSYTVDGKNWGKLKDIEPEGKRFWRPKTYDNNTWFCPIFEDGDVKLYSSNDGINWKKNCTIYDGPGANEIDFAFYADGSIVSTIRIQSFSAFGDNKRNTRIYRAAPPYTSWEYDTFKNNRLDGPCLFNYTDTVFAVGRSQPENDNFLQQSGSTFARKRTSIFLIWGDFLLWLTDLPSNGDTSYPAAVVIGDDVYISYYTCVPTNDYPWFLGTISPTNVLIVKIEMDSLMKIADDADSIKGPKFPWLDYVLFFSLIVACILLGTFISIKVYKKLREKAKERT